MGAITLGLIPSQTYAENTRREIIPYSDNETPSYIPNFYLGNGELSLDITLASAKVENMIVYKAIDGPDDLLKLAVTLKEDIKNHIETRLQLFHVQTLVAYRTQLAFGKFNTKAQAGIKKKEKQENESPSKLVEAHPSTLPNLQYVDQKDLQADYIDIFQLKPKILGLLTSFYKNNNVTHKLPLFVNEVDSLIDKNSKLPYFENFRLFCIELLKNLAEQNGRPLQKGFYNFLLNLHQILLVASQAIIPIYKKQVIDFYLEVVRAYLQKTHTPDFWKALLFSRNLQDQELEKEMPAFPLYLQKKLSLEISCCQKIDAISQCAHQIVGVPQHFNYLIKHVIIQLSSVKDPFFKAVSEIDENYPNSTDTIKEYAIMSSQDPKVIGAVHAFFNSFQDTESLKNELSKNLKQHPIAQIIKQSVIQGKTRINNLDHILIRVLLNLGKSRNTPSRATMKLYQLLYISPSQVADYPNTRSFTSCSETLMKNAQIIQLAGELFNLLDAWN